MGPLGVWNEGVGRNSPPKWKDPQDKGAFMWRRETSHIHSSGLSAGLVCWRGLGSNSATAERNEMRKENRSRESLM